MYVASQISVGIAALTGSMLDRFVHAPFHLPRISRSPRLSPFRLPSTSSEVLAWELNCYATGAHIILQLLINAVVCGRGIALSAAVHPYALTTHSLVRLSVSLLVLPLSIFAACFAVPVVVFTTSIAARHFGAACRGKMSLQCRFAALAASFLRRSSFS